MTQEKQNAVNAIEEKAGLIGDVADHIWEYAELSLQEVKSAALYCEVLEKEGFQVEKGSDRKAWYRSALRLPWRRGRSGQGIYGQRRCLESPGCSVDLASRGCE